MTIKRSHVIISACIVVFFLIISASLTSYFLLRKSADVSRTPTEAKNPVETTVPKPAPSKTDAPKPTSSGTGSIPTEPMKIEPSPRKDGKSSAKSMAKPSRVRGNPAESHTSTVLKTLEETDKSKPNPPPNEARYLFQGSSRFKSLKASRMVRWPVDDTTVEEYELTDEQIMCLAPGIWLNESTLDWAIFTLFWLSSANVRVLASSQTDILTNVGRNEWIPLRGRSLHEKDAFIMPINENDRHWMLALVLFERKSDVPTRAHIAIMDPLGGERPHLLGLVKDWIRFQLDSHGLSSAIITSSHVTVPRQPNYYDCGLFVINMVDHFLMDASNLTKYLLQRGVDLANWFPPSEGVELRSILYNKLISTSYTS